MRRILVLAAILSAGMASQAAEARDRSFGFRHFAPHAGTEFFRPHHGFEFRHRGFFGKHRHFEPSPFAHFRHSGFAFKFEGGSFAFRFGQVPHFKPRHFGRLGRTGAFGDCRGFAFGFGHVPHFKAQRFGPGHHGAFSTFRHSRHVAPRHHRGFEFRKPRHLRAGHLMGFNDGSWRHERSPHAAPGPASFEAVLKQLENQGFRHVPRLLRAWSDRQPGT